MKFILGLLALLALTLVLTAGAPACDVPAQAFRAPGVGCYDAVPAQAFFPVQRAPAPVYVPRQRQAFFAPAPAYGPSAGFAPAGSGVNVNVNSGNVGRQRFFRR